MKKCFLYLMLLVFSQNAFCQPKKGKIVDIVIHRVELGETIVMISKKYLVNPSVIYGANKFIIDGIDEGMVLQIPVVRKEGQEYATVQYPEAPIDQDIPTTAVAVVEKPAITEPEVIKEEPVAVVEQRDSEQTKQKPVIKEPEVIKEETVAVIEPSASEQAKQKPIIKEPEIVKEEPVAVVDPSVSEQAKQKPIIKEPEVVKEETVAMNNTRGPRSEPSKMMVTKIERDVDTDYTIGKKETLYGISLKYDVSMEEIMALNEEVLKDGVKAGLVIRIPANKKIINWDTSKSVTDSSTTSKSEDIVVENPIVETKTAVATNPKTTPTASKSNVNTTGDKIVDGNIIHKVEPKETLYSLSKKYNTTVEIINANNENVRKSGLGIGFIIKIPVVKAGESPANTGAVAELDKKIEAFKAPVRTLNETDIIHKVEAKETLFSLATKYKVSVYDIRSNNQNVMTNGLLVGQTIRIPASKTIVKEETKPETSENQIADNNTVKEKTPEDESFVVGDIITTVQSTETIESIAKKYDVTPEDIIKNNANLLKDGKVKPGQVIKVPAKQENAIEFSPDTFD